jgi:hypothetical protein
MRRGGYPSRPEHSSDVEEEYIPESHLATQLRYGFSLRMGQRLRLRMRADKEIPASMQPGFKAYQI